MEISVERYSTKDDNRSLFKRNYKPSEYASSVCSGMIIQL